MSRVKGRVNKLFLKTHRFFSLGEMKMCLEGSQLNLEDNGIRFADYEKEIKELYQLEKALPAEDFSKKLKDITVEKPELVKLFFFEQIKDDFKENPHGRYFDKKNSEQFIKQMIKRYQTEKKKKS